MTGSTFIDISLVIFIAVGIAALTKLLKQPLIISYIITGLVASALHLVSTENLAPFAQFGVALLLFMVGLNLNPKVIKDIGKVALLTGIGQILFTFIIGFLIVKLLGYSTIISVYVSLALAFSSTIVIVKLLGETGNLETLHGKITVGFLIVQDSIAMLLLMVIASFTSGGDLISLAVGTLLKGVGLLIVLFLLSVFAIPKITNYIAKSQEFMLLFSLGWCFALASLFAYLNFLLEAGALVAGVTLSLSPYRYEISARLKPIRDFFLVLFFIVLGSQIMPSEVLKMLTPIIVLALFVLIGNPLAMMLLMAVLGYTRRTSFLTGLAVAQISEFSFILIALGIKVGHLSPEVLSMVAFIGLITIAGSSYFMIYGGKLYSLLLPLLNIFPRKKSHQEHFRSEDKYEIILLGYNRIGYDLLNSFRRMKKKFLVIDYNPDVIAQLSREGVECRYGDAADTELLEELHLRTVKMIVSTIPDIETNLLLLHKVRETNKKAIILMVSHQIDEAMKLYDEGASYVILPHFLGAHHTSMLIEENGFEMGKFLKEKSQHIKHLRRRKLAGHEHPRVGRG
ncbi:cation:proton antiporter [Candidatus Woesearchaeota archaeon]|nr:cation:proton antiporter [Candidatus Woesearchaeota archaeon]